MAHGVIFDEINPASVEDEGVEGMVLSPSGGASASQFAYRYMEPPPESGAFGNSFFRMLAVPNCKSRKAIDLAENPKSRRKFHDSTCLRCRSAYQRRRLRI